MCHCYADYTASRQPGGGGLKDTVNTISFSTSSPFDNGHWVSFNFCGESHHVFAALNSSCPINVSLEQGYVRRSRIVQSALMSIPDSVQIILTATV